MKQEVYDAVVTRSGGRCEVEVEHAGTWLRCGSPATDVHHLLPKSRGGRILDDVGETCHLIHLCREHHAQAHSRKEAHGMMIDGSVTWDKLRNRPVYQGTDPELTRRYTPTVG
jgi:5-methylcytosine-specific restriction endonuclease McrA